MPFTIKRNDRRPRYRVNLTSDGVAVNLTTATGVKFLMKQGTTLKVDGAAVVVDPLTGLVEYVWAAGDTDTAGEYNVEFEVDWGGEKQTFPSVGYFTCTIETDLG
jgi:hypothetical protein